MRRVEVLIAGGGPAGSATAIRLARGGARPLLVERSSDDREIVCGGFLGWDALAALRDLGVDPVALGARPIHRLRLADRFRTVEARLPAAGAGLSRRTLDAALRRVARDAGTDLLQERSVRSVDADIARLDRDETIAFESLVLATGKHELRGAARATAGRRQAVGLRAAVPPTPALRLALGGYIELHLFDGGYAGLLLQEDGDVNICLSVARGRLAAAGSPRALVATLMQELPLLRQRIGDGSAARWQAIANVPYGWKATKTVSGRFRVGDQAAVIASLAGDGIAIALRSGMAAAESLLARGPAGANAFQRDFAHRAARPLAVAELLRRSVEARFRRKLVMRLARSERLARLAARLTRIG